MRFLLMLALAPAAVLSAVSANAETPPGAPPLVVRDARVFDGDRVLPRATVVVADGKIVAVGADVAVPPGAAVVDGAGKTLLPGLIDAHAHVWDAGQLRRSAVFGVTTVLDMFTSPETMKTLREEQEQGAPDRAWLFSAGTLATAPGGHGTEYGMPIPTLAPDGDAQAFVDARVAEGSDYLKIVRDDGSAYGMKLPTLTAAQVKALVAAAHRRGKLAVLHPGTLDDCTMALDAGVDGLMHLFMDAKKAPDFGRRVAKAKAFVVPTLSVLRAVSGVPDGSGLTKDADLAPYLDAGDLTALRKTFPIRTADGAYASAEEAVRALRDAKVPLLAGTDAPNAGTAYGASVHGELAALVQAGLTPVAALRAATASVADAFRLAGRGRIAKGAIADLVLVAGDPTADIRATRRIVSVWRAGVAVDRAARREAVAAERAKIAALKEAPPPSEDGAISDFEGGDVAARFGAGWMVSTDAFRGGRSKATTALVADGTGGHALEIAGDLAGAGPVAWAGAMFSPGKFPMTPANLSKFKALVFRARGAARRYTAYVFTQSGGFMPARQGFDVGPDWATVRLPFASFGIEGFDVTGLFLGSTEGNGAFAFEVDDVRLE